MSGTIAKMKEVALLISKSDEGYDQGQRYSFISGKTIKPHKEGDCSAVCSQIAKLAGYKVPSGNITTANFAANMKKAGFKVIRFKSMKQVQEGDFLLKPRHHVEFAYTAKKFYSAHLDENGNIKGGRAGDQTGRETGFRAAYNRSDGWDYIVRPPAEPKLKMTQGVVTKNKKTSGTSGGSSGSAAASPTASIDTYAAASGTQAAPKYRIIIQTSAAKFIEPAVEDDITWDLELRDVPGKLTFSCRDDAALKFREGNPVAFTANGKGVFYGFIFNQSRDTSGSVKVTAYDQIRYLKNKDTYVFRKKTATQILKKLAKDFGLNLGTCANTKKKIKSLVEDNVTLLDMVQDALDLTVDSRKTMYFLYDDYGKLRIRSAESMKLSVLINHDTAEDFSFESSIDSDTYNVVKLVYTNAKKKTRDVYMAKSSKAINNWGRLQYFEKLNNPKNGKKKANAVLKLKNRVERSLSVKGAFGDIRVRAGSTIPVALQLGAVTQSGYLLVEKVSHKFTADRHTMDLTLKGGKYFGSDIL
jgi:hypothetical protein